MATINVTSLSDSGAGTLRQAITDLNAQTGSHTITFTGLTGTITLASNLPAINKSMTITGPGLSSLTVSGNNLYRVFLLNSGFTIYISGLTIANSRNTGGGITSGGGILNSGATLTVTDCTFTGCYCVGYGGAIFATSTTTVSNCTFTNNTATSFGGGINSQASLTVTGTTFTSNTAQNGSGISSEGTGNITIGNCTFSGNSGTAYNSGGTTQTVYNCTFNGNNGANGAGVRAYGGSLSILSSTISGNTGTVTSGVYLGEYCSLTLKNSIISGNTGGVGVKDFGSYNDNRSIASAATNIIGTISTASATSAARVIGDPLLVALASNGGTTQTMAVSAGSVAIGAGNAAASNASPVSGLDQRGTTRSATAPTIGAYEYVATTTTTTTTTPAPSTFNFPTSPSTGQVYTFNGIIWVWNGIGWKKRLILPSQDIFMSSNYGGL